MRANEADHARLRERRPEHRKPFDTRLVSGASLADLARGNLREEYESERTSDEGLETFPSLRAPKNNRGARRIFTDAAACSLQPSSRGSETH